MQIIYEVTDWPKTNAVVDLIAYFEGNLTIIVNDKVFFDESGIPLVELGLVVQRWLAEIEGDDLKTFVYLSMDHDEAILVFKPANQNEIILESIWQLPKMPIITSFSQVKDALIKYTQDLSITLDKHYGIDLKNIASQNV